MCKFVDFFFLKNEIRMERMANSYISFFFGENIQKHSRKFTKFRKEFCFIPFYNPIVLQI